MLAITNSGIEESAAYLCINHFSNKRKEVKLEFKRSKIDWKKKPAKASYLESFISPLIYSFSSQKLECKR